MGIQCIPASCASREVVTQKILLDHLSKSFPSHEIQGYQLPLSPNKKNVKIVMDIQQKYIKQSSQ
jgi:hypothetical protein